MTTQGKVYVGTAKQRYARNTALAADVTLRQDEDVLDTWFSSALWPFSTLGWPEQTDALKTFYPGSVLVTGFDIIFFWVARMIMIGLKFAGDVPFREVYITGLIRDENGDKMSKSKGNVIDPLDLIDGIDLPEPAGQAHHRPDAAATEAADRKGHAQAVPERHSRFRHRCTALHFCGARQHRPGYPLRPQPHRGLPQLLQQDLECGALRADERRPTGKSRTGSAGLATTEPAGPLDTVALQPDREAVRRHFADYRFDLAARALYEFIWNEYCDWYLELTKPLLLEGGAPAAEQAQTRRTLVTVLESLLRAIHPLMPFISEEIWQRVAPLAGACGDTIMLQRWPEPSQFPVDEAAEAELEWIRGFVLGVRQIRGEMDIPPGKRLTVLLQDATADDQRLLDVHARYLRDLARLVEIRLLPAGEKPPASATALLGSLKILVPMAGLIDVAAERSRLEKNRQKLITDLARIDSKLTTESFVSNAPAAVVEKERERQAALRRDLAKLDEQLKQLAAL